MNDLHIKLKELRISQGKTLEDVAQVVGVGRSTVRKWETGMIENMRRDKIPLLAKALNTTPDYLMGWENNENKNTPSKQELTESEEIMLNLFRRLTEENQKVIVEWMTIATLKHE